MGWKKTTTDVIENGRTRNAVNNLKWKLSKMKTDSGLNDKEMMEKSKSIFKIRL